MKEIIKKIIFIFSITIGLPVTFFVAVGYWTASDSTFKESFKAVLEI